MIRFLFLFSVFILLPFTNLVGSVAQGAGFLSGKWCGKVLGPCEQTSLRIERTVDRFIIDAHIFVKGAMILKRPKFVFDIVSKDGHNFLYTHGVQVGELHDNFSSFGGQQFVVIKGHNAQVKDLGNFRLIVDTRMPDTLQFYEDFKIGEQLFNPQGLMTRRYEKP